jgi:hypothetical protein
MQLEIEPRSQQSSHQGGRCGEPKVRHLIAQVDHIQEQHQAITAGAVSTTICNDQQAPDRDEHFSSATRTTLPASMLPVFISSTNLPLDASKPQFSLTAYGVDDNPAIEFNGPTSASRDSIPDSKEGME